MSLARFIDWQCPGCDAHVKVRGATEVVHEYPRRNNRLTQFARQPSTVKV